MEIENTLHDRGLRVGVVIASDIVVRNGGAELKQELDRLVAERQSQEFPPAVLKDSVRALLKGGGFKPSGRNKPASEYLAQAAREGRFPLINNLVDVNNLISLQSGLPISLLDTRAIGTRLLMRYGREGEKYVFNSANQEIDLAGLICACSGEQDEPRGNPVKDSLTGKIKDDTANVIGVIYSPAQLNDGESLTTYVKNFAHWLTKEGGAARVETIIA